MLRKLTFVLTEIVPYDITSSDDRAALEADLIASKDWSDAPEQCGTDFTAWAGLVDSGANTADPDKNDDGVTDDPFTFGGQGWSGNQVMWAKINNGGSDIFNRPLGSRSIAHEIGHVFGRPHVDCGNPANPGFYPYNPCQLDNDTSDNGHWGYDFISLTAIDPATTRDLMAYGSPRWTSDYTWDVIYDRLDPNGLLSSDHALKSLDVSTDILWVRGIVDNDDGVAELYPAYHLPLSEMTDNQIELYLSMPTVPDSDYAIVLMDSNDQPLASQPIPKAQLQVYDETLADPTVFHVVLELAANTAGVRLVQLSTNAVLGSWDISSAAPSINVTSLIRDAANEELVLEWSASDADGEDLYFMVQFSYDGDRKRAIMIDRHYLTAHETLRISTKGLSGKKDNGLARIQLFVSDGVNTTNWLSRLLLIPGHDPVAHINYRALENGRYTLRGMGTDVEDGLLPDSTLVWSIDGVQVGAGSWPIDAITVPTGEFVTVQLTVTDSDGQTDTATVHLGNTTPTTVIYLPTIFRN